VLEREFGQLWGTRPISDVTPLEISTAIQAIKNRGAPYQAHNAFGWVRGLYNWAIGTGLYGIDTSPVTRLKPRDLIGRKLPRQRTLTDEELRDLWAGVREVGYPYAWIVWLLILTGQRKSEIGRASWSEIQPANWRHVDAEEVDVSLVIPPDRMKKAAAHVVPLVPESVTLLRDIQKGAAGDFIFSATDGRTAANGYSKAKEKIDHEVAKIRAARRAGPGAEPEKGDELPGWVLHDIRRTVRTHLSALPVEDLVRELVIAHAKPGLHKVYDQWSYAAEKRRALTLWTARLQGIVEPPTGDNVVALRDSG
ncbi:hypothetical protein HY633_01305, partial [Candidatus Uhrbacteria bacterium]|nr:hypothetical protein [Candidatus Uhrbacteria bacterium]